MRRIVLGNPDFIHSKNNSHPQEEITSYSLDCQIIVGDTRGKRQGCDCWNCAVNLGDAGATRELLSLKPAERLFEPNPPLKLCG